MSAFRSLSKAMVLGLARDKLAVFFMLLFPLMFLLLFGALFRGDTTPQVRIAQVGAVEVLDGIQGAALAELQDVLDVERTGDREAALAEVRSGTVDAALREEDGELELRYSAADQVRAGTVHGVIDSLVQQANQAASGQPVKYRMNTARVEDESTKAIQFLTPGLLGWAIAMGAAFMSSFTLVHWRKKRILRRLWLAPVGPGTVIGARIGVSLALAFVQTAIFVLVALIPYYGLRLTGYWWLSLPLVACGTLAFMSIGLLIGSWARTEEAANGALQAVVLPMAFLSGSFFPTDNLPGWLQRVTDVLPLKHLNEAMMAVLSRDGGWSDAWPAMGILLAFTVVLTAIASRLFRWDDA
jgi:ABC-2 type transport system permease protein